MKNIIKSLLFSVIVLIGCFIALENQVQADTLQVTSYEYNQDTQLTNYSDGSFAVINTNENTYEFTPVNFIGDWCYVCECIEDLNALVLDYKTVYDNGFLEEKLNTIGDLFVTDEYINSDDNYIKVFNDDSFVMVNKYNNSYEFYPNITDNTNGTWCLCFDTEKDLNNCLNVYKSLLCEGEW